MFTAATSLLRYSHLLAYPAQKNFPYKIIYTPPHASLSSRNEQVPTRSECLVFFVLEFSLRLVLPADISIGLFVEC